MKGHTRFLLIRSVIVIMSCFMILGVLFALIYIQKENSFDQRNLEDLHLISEIKNQQVQDWLDEKQHVAKSLSYDQGLYSALSLWRQEDLSLPLLSRFSEYLETLELEDVVGIDLNTGVFIGLQAPSRLKEDLREQLEEVQETGFSLTAPLAEGLYPIHAPVGLFIPLRSDGEDIDFILILVSELNKNLLASLDLWPSTFKGGRSCLLYEDLNGEFLAAGQRAEKAEELPTLIRECRSCACTLKEALKKDRGVISQLSRVGSSRWHLFNHFPLEEYDKNWKGDAVYLITIYILTACILMIIVVISISSSRRYYSIRQAETEVKLNESEHRYRQLLEHTPDGVMIFSKSGEIVRSNETAIDILRLEGRCTDIHSLLDEITDRFLEDLSMTGHAHCELLFKPDLWILFEAARLSNMMNIIYIRDITEIKLANRKKEELEESLQQAQRLESIGRLAGGIAHDFNNILQAILGYTNLAMLQISEEDTDMCMYLGEIETAVNRSISLTRDLLGFAREQPVIPKNIRVKEHLSHISNMLTQLIGTNISLTWETKDPDAAICLDPNQFDQIITNLVINAKEAGAHRIHIEIFTTQDPDWVQISVTDDGRGMSEEQKQHIFEPFYSSKDASEGAGLGLANVYGIIKQNNGTIMVESTRKAGTEFTLRFPPCTSTISTIKTPTENA